MSKGIDYGMGTANIDVKTGIRFGVIHHGDVYEAWSDSSEAEYGEPHCPKCGNECVSSDTDHSAEDLCLACEHNHGNRFKGGKEPVVKDAHCHDCKCKDPDWANDHSRLDLGYEEYRGYGREYACDACKLLLDGEHVFGDEPVGWYLDDGEYKATQGGNDCDIFVLKSSYYTRATFCSPCAPGACSLTSPCENGAKAYCFGHDWFEDGVAPYPVYSVATDELVQPG